MENFNDSIENSFSFHDDIKNKTDISTTYCSDDSRVISTSNNSSIVIENDSKKKIN